MSELMMSVEEAAQRTGYAPFTIRQLCRMGAFTAEKPRGNKGGWWILRPSLERWWSDRRRATTNRRAA
ncbi:MAG: helix-turn-helix domain-containing protein [Verrucomicrobia bacterium]|nr:helix-turn-helix domain-containing protein [Verrucomicrobiota bacterium]